MKRILSQNIAIPLGVALLSLCLFALQSAHAQGPAGMPENREPRMGNATVTNERAEVRTENREERRALLEQKVQDRVVNLASNVAKRFTAATERLANIIGRLETRIEKLEDLGVDTGAAKSMLAEAKESNEDTLDALMNLESVQRAVSGESPRESFMSIRMQFATIHGLLKQAHALLRETVALLKVAVGNAELDRGVSSSVNDVAPEAAGDDTAE